ncbi:uncharacterized protein LOC133519692 [Cydia pomonella]|uniref:uncharacterized protein LOC133519692 n=1 Tax=Cydia pomonella TaxID=82600 RepID=UPI002ADD444B|nr:uncharacterized protein LOC133519692 [Cydia pomonella]
MENFLRDRLELRIKRFDENLESAEALILKCNSGTDVMVQEVMKLQLSMKQSLNSIQLDIDKYIVTNNENTDILRSALEKQMKAEELLIELELILNIHSNSHNKISTKTVKLPRIELLKFDGDILKWTEFWDRFTANVHSQNLDDVEKLAYLISLLEKEAKEAVQGLTMTNANYQVAIDTLKTRYGSTQQVIDSHYEALNRTSRCEYTAEDCRKTLNKIENHLRVLSSLGENIESNSFRSIILDKFPEKVIYELNLLLVDDQTIAGIRNTLNKIVVALEKSKTNPPLQKDHTATTDAFISIENRPRYHRGKRIHTQTTSLHKMDNTPRNNNRKRPAKSNTDREMKKPKLSCIFCSGPHFNDTCPSYKTPDDRKKKLSNRCFMCLKLGHRAHKCRRHKKCYHCKGNHNRALCPKREPGKSEPHHAVTLNSTGHCFKRKSFLQTATAQVVHKTKTLNCRLLLDSGSSRSYITTDLAKHLDLTSANVDYLLIFIFGTDKPNETLSPCTDITIKTKRGVEKSIHVNVVPRITDRIPIQEIPKIDIVDIPADSYSKNQSVNMLIGNDYYFSFIRNNKIQIDTDLYLIDTDFGWIMSGHHDKDNQENDNILAVVTYYQNNVGCKCYTEPDLPLRQSDLKFLWSLENIGITDSVKGTREEEAVRNFNDTVKYQEGRYYVKWPWTTYPPHVPTNYGLAYGRLKGLVQRLDKPTLQEYNEILMEQLKAEIIEVVQVDSDVRNQSVPPINYLPHHIVKQSTKRGRIVYDGSARLKDQQSLNECLYKGPCMLQDLTSLLLNFRIHKIGIIADVEKAFLQIGLQEEDREVTRFLWLKDINKPLSDENILHLRFCRVPFGIISSPFLLTATIRYHISQKDSMLLKKVANKCYVDNLVTGTDTLEEAVQLYDESKKAFEELSMNLRDWTSNDKAFSRKVPQKYRAKESDKIKVLGLLWNKEQDVLTLNINKEVFTDRSTDKVTKREVLSILASLYDPCGIVSPLLMPIKLFLQELWRKDYKWDSPVSQELLLKWKKIEKNLSDIKEVEVPRYVEANVNKGSENELHCFADAAKDSYAAVVYLRSSDGSNIKTSFLLSKNRVAPLDKKMKDGKKTERKMTIPQLELLGCVIGNRLLTYIKETIELPITRQYLWTDSLVVLNWIHSNKLLPPFIANRTEEIKRNVGLETYYVNTKENPADIATRPELWIQKKSVWLEGPAFLSKEKSKWPKDIHLKSHQEVASFPAVLEGPKDQSSDIDIPLESVNDNEQRSDQNEVTSQVKEIKNLQQRFFPDEIKGKRTDLSRNLGLFTDVDGLLRCKGRMMHANWSYDMRYPVLLPRDCEFTKKVVKEIHEKNYHVGASHTLDLVRQQYWIPKGRPVVERILRKCTQCVKHGGGPYPLPPTPALPAERANYSTPFTYTGLDYFGPVYVATENGQQKRWICLMTCLAVRAIHLEVVKNLTADECIMALRRFMSTRGVPVAIVSDNALYFKLSSEILKSDYCIKNNIKWKFIPQLAPWHGAFYERLVGLVKHCMKRTLEKLLLNDTQLLTVIKEIEAVVNSRPLTRVGPDMDIVLRPCDFLSLGRCLNLEISESYRPDQDDTRAKQNLLDSWKRGQNMLKHFKNMFINQYLTSLRERYQHSHKQPRVKSHKEPSVGDLIQIKGESKNRNTWRVGKIVQLIRGSDGYCRVAQVQVGGSIFTRSIGHLYPLELEEPPSAPVETIETVEPQPSVIDTIQNGLGTTDIDEMLEETEQREISTESQGSADIVSNHDTEERESNTENSEERMSTTSQQPEEDSLKTSHPTDIISDVPDIETQEESQPQEVTRRAAAIRAREKIAQWTRQLFAFL